MLLTHIRFGMQKITPPSEWRTFGRRFGEAEAQIPTEVTADGILRLDGNRARGLQRVVRGLGLGGLCKYQPIHVVWQC